MTDTGDDTAIKKRLILELSNSEARGFLLKEESYNHLDLPPYFIFSELDHFLDGKTVKSLQSYPLETLIM